MAVSNGYVDLNRNHRSRDIIRAHESQDSAFDHNRSSARYDDRPRPNRKRTVMWPSPT
jgi:hypothetical protein